MASKGLPLRLVSRSARGPQSLLRQASWNAQRNASSTAEVFEDLDTSSSMTTPGPSEDVVKSFDPVERSRSRTTQLPPSRYRFRPPKYYRGPLHPHQPPPPSNPASRLFVPGPFSLPRLQQTYTSTLAPDLMTLSYLHIPPGFHRPPPAPRLRTWEGDSPYFKNRPLRPPLGGISVLPLVRKPITFRNVPRLERITVHSFPKGAMADSAYLHVAGLVLQSITNVRATVHRARKTIAAFGLKEGRAVSVSCDLRGEDMYCFLAKVVDLVMPKIKEYQGVSGGSGDGSGNLGFGFPSETVAVFPEIEVNYDMYPPKMIPYIDVFVHTTATNDKDARLLLGSMGVPFYGKHVN